uniref:Uncharacterized protein n=1 Tax=Quercus lobata TaxID=97700 RepID=A0A7N2R9M4_QUELO
MAQNGSVRKSRSNILVTGTTGTGKITTSFALAEATQLRHIIIRDLVCDELEDLMEEGGNIVDYHGCDFFPERWFDQVVVLQTDNTEAKESYPEDIVVALKSDTIEDITRNVASLTDWVGSWHPAT